MIGLTDSFYWWKIILFVATWSQTFMSKFHFFYWNLLLKNKFFVFVIFCELRLSFYVLLLILSGFRCSINWFLSILRIFIDNWLNFLLYFWFFHFNYLFCYGFRWIYVRIFPNNFNILDIKSIWHDDIIKKVCFLIFYFNIFKLIWVVRRKLIWRRSIVSIIMIWYLKHFEKFVRRKKLCALLSFKERFLFLFI